MTIIRFLAAMLAVIGLLGAPAASAQTETTEAGASTATAPEPGKLEVQTGIYVLRLTDVSPRDGRFDVDFWIWFRWKGSDLRPDETFELANGVITNREANPLTQDGEYTYATARVQGTIFKDFDVRKFPLDDHVITIEIEDSTYEEHVLAYVPDNSTALDPNVMVAGWAVGLKAPEAATHVYPTNYGVQSSGSVNAKYSRFSVPITLERTSYGPLFKLFWISFLSVMLALLAFKVKSDDLDARFGMGVGSIFAASANAFVIADSLPNTTNITFAEQINLLAVGTIFLTVFISIWSLRLRYIDRDEDSVTLDNWSLLVIGVAYVFLMGVILFINLV